MLILLITVHHKSLLKSRSVPASPQGAMEMVMLMFIVDGAATGLGMSLALCCVISFPGYRMTLRKWEKEREAKHLGSVNECGSSLTHARAGLTMRRNNVRESNFLALSPPRLHRALRARKSAPVYIVHGVMFLK